MTMAKEYIPREDVINDIGELFTICRETLPNECGHHFIVESELQIHLDFVRNLPAADVVEVRHASWIEDGYYNEPCVCSNCGEPCKDTVMGKPRWNYCPNCGAKMDGGQDE